METANCILPLFWVCVIRRGESSYRVLMTSDLRKVLTVKFEQEILIYVRMFTEMQEAIGHKLFLENLSVNSLLANAQRFNPRGKDLKELVMLYYS